MRRTIFVNSNTHAHTHTQAHEIITREKCKMRSAHLVEVEGEIADDYEKSP